MDTKQTAVADSSDKTSEPAEKRSIDTCHALYLALVAGAHPASLDYSELDQTRADATIVLAKQTRQDHDVLSQDELDDELAELLGGETRDELYNRTSLLEGNVEGLRERAEKAERSLALLNRSHGAAIAFLTTALRGRRVFDRLQERRDDRDIAALADLAAETVKALEQGIDSYRERAAAADAAEAKLKDSDSVEQRVDKLEGDRA